MAGLDDKGWATGYDLETRQRLGTLIPQLGDKYWACIGADGHYVGSEGVADHLVYVALTEAGHQETYTPSEFARVFGWKNEPSRARFAGLAK